MKILVINTGSSSIKYQLFDMNDQSVLAGGLIEKIGEEGSFVSHKVYQRQIRKVESSEVIADHRMGLERVVSLLTDKDLGVINDKSEVKAVGHRVVHGGEAFVEPVVINDSVLDAIRENIPLAPLHNPSNITGIEVSWEMFPQAVQVAVFDTAFHHSIPEKAYRYALPDEMYSIHKIRRYGFHGTSHQYVAEKAADFLEKKLEALNMITIHLGNGGSIAAIQSGVSVDTSMGMTPLEGLIMGTRSGDIDPAIQAYIMRNTEMSIDEVDQMLNSQSGLKGICGKNDMREILAACEKGDEKSQLAVDMYCYRVKKYIGAYFAILGQVDALVFTAGIGEHSSEIRQMVCKGLENLGFVMDLEKNQVAGSGIQELHAEFSRAKILLIPTNEELKIAMETRLLVPMD
jgi:acetate kinase